jgi:hypothetical protein
MATVPTPLNRIDRFFAGLAAGNLLLDAGLWLYVRWRLPALPAVLAIHYNSAGQVDRIGVREQLYILPAIGLVVLLANGLGGYFGLYRRDQPLTYLFLSVGLVVQLLLAGAAIQLMH